MKLTSLSKELSNRERTPISYDDILKCLPPAVKKITVMKELDKLPTKCTTADIFGHATNCCLFCNRYDHSGRVITSHWIVLLKRKNRVEYSDSLGNTINGLLHLLGPVKSNGFDYWRKHTRVLATHSQLQRDSLQDCGDWAAIRCCLHSLSNKQFYRFIKSSPVSPDITAAFLTFLPLMKYSLAIPQ